MQHTAPLLLGAVPVDVEYEATPAEPRTWMHPGCPASVDILAVRIGAHKVDDPESVFSEWQIEAWETAILEGGGAIDPRQRALDAYHDYQDAVDSERRLALV